MLNLIKYDILHNCRTYLVEYIIFLVLAIILPFIPSAETQSILIFVTILLIFCLMIFNLVTICAYYYKDMFSQNAYLTLTLPLSSNELLLAKIISACIWIVISCLVLILGFTFSITIYASSMVSFQEIMELASTFFGAVGEIFLDSGLWQIFPYLFISLVKFVISIFTIMTVVQTKYTRRNKVWWGLGIFIAYMIISSFVSNLLLSTDVAIELMSKLGLYATIISGIIEVVIFYFICKYILDHMIEIE